MNNLPSPAGITAMVAASAALMILFSYRAAIRAAEGIEAFARLLRRHAGAWKAATVTYSHIWRGRIAIENGAECVTQTADFEV
jgi:hypothetical protein